MSPLLVLLTTAALGVEVGWEPLPGGGHEYTIQIEPQLLGVLERGTEEIFSEVPPELNVRRYRIKVGTGQLPRNVGQPAAPIPAQPDRPPPAANDFDNLPPAGETDAGGLPGVETDQPDDNAASPPAFSPPPGSYDPGEPGPGETDPREPQPDEPARDGLDTGMVGSGANRVPPGAQPPGKLPPDGQASGPIEQAGFESQSDASHDAAPVRTQRPTLPDVPNRPWTVLVGSVVLLCCSLGANAYLGWIAWDARQRYRNVVANFRTAS